MNCIDLNNKLSEVYRTFLKNFEKSFDEKEKQGLSLPILTHVFPEYYNTKYKILFVGRETYSWYGKMNEIEKLNINYLIDCYKKFEFAINYKGKNSPFWRFIHSFYKKVNPDSSKNGFLWTNFSKADFNKATPNSRIKEKSIEGYKLLRKEITVIKPDMVIFLTSWNYDNKIREIFDKVEFEIIEKRKLSKLKHEDLPELTFRTYHPNYLSRSGQFKNIIDTITSYIPC